MVGATSPTGMRIASHLAGSGWRVVALGRKIERLARLEDTAETRRFDLDDPDARTALADATHVISTLHAGLAPRLIPLLPQTLERIVFFGSTWAFSKIPNPRADAVRTGLEAIGKSSLPAVTLLPTMIYGPQAESNVSRLAALIRTFHVIPLPAGGSTAIQPIHVDDVAACATAALDLEAPSSQPIVIAGPEAIPYRDFVKECARALGTWCLIPGVPMFALRLLPALGPLLPRRLRVGKGEIERLLEDKSQDISEMRRLLRIEPRSYADGLAFLNTTELESGPES